MQLDSFDYLILQAAAAKGLRPYRRGWRADYNAQHFPAHRLSALVQTPYAYFETDEVGRVFVVSQEGHELLARPRPTPAQADAIARDQLLEAFDLGRLA